MTLAGTNFRSWRGRLEAAKRKIAGVEEEIRSSGDAALIERMDAANADLGECLSILGATIELARDPRGKRPMTTREDEHGQEA